MIRTIFHSAWVGLFCLILTPVLAHDESYNLKNNANTLARAAEQYAAALLEAEDRGESSQYEKRIALQSLAKAAKSYRSNLDRYFGFRMIYRYHGSRIASNYKRILKIHEYNPQFRNEKLDLQLEQAYQGWKKLHATFKHYKGHLL